MSNIVRQNPKLEQVKRLLSQADLIASDLDTNALTHFYGIEHNQNLIGVIGLEPSAPLGLLRSLAVAKEARGQQLGRQLVSALEQHARDLSIDTLYLLTNDAQDYFRTLGFDECSRDNTPEVIKQSTQFSQLCPASAVIMCKTLS